MLDRKIVKNYNEFINWYTGIWDKPAGGGQTPIITKYDFI